MVPRPIQAVLFSLLAIGGCALAPPPVPMHTIELDGTPHNQTLVVMLPGINDAPGKFLTSGFVDGFGRREYDLVAVDARWRYYSNDSIVTRLHEDVIAPARARGYRS